MIRTALTILLCSAASLSAASEPAADAVLRGWQPPTALVGESNHRSALKSMRELSSLQRVMLTNTRVDTATDRFVNDLWATFERFDLKRFYTMLPERTPEGRAFTVFGAIEDGRYSLQRGVPAFKGGSTEPQAFGELAFNVGAREIKAEKDSYLLDGRLQMGFGPVDWATLAAASHKTLHLMVDSDGYGARGNTPAQPYAALARAMNAHLGSADIAVIAPLWAAFPAMWDLLADVGQVRDVMVEADSSTTLRHLQFIFAVEPERMAKRYPALARHLENLGPITHFDLHVKSPEGELLHLVLDSEALTVAVSGYVHDGFLVPRLDDGTLGKPFDTMFNAPWTLAVEGSGNTKILGVKTAMDDLHIDVAFIPRPEGAALTSSMTHIPRVAVSGNALGFMPTGLIDVFLPTNIDELMTEFMTVACLGNDGKGIYSEVTLKRSPSAVGNTLVAETRLQALDNVFVRFGMNIVNDRFLPEPEVSLDIHRLMVDTQEAFNRDLERFAGVASL